MIGRDTYSTGQYIEHFRPDDRHNPFHALYAAKRSDVIACVRSRLQSGAAILDLGGGPGRMAVTLANDYRVTLSDVSAAMLRIADRAAIEGGAPARNLELQMVDASAALPFPSDSFDGALCIDLLVHLSEPLATLRELHRVLKPEGELLVDMSNSSPWWILRYPRVLGRRPNDWMRTWRAGGVLPEWQATVRHYSDAEYTNMLRRAGFDAMYEWRYGPAWCPVWFLRRCRRTQR